MHDLIATLGGPWGAAQLVVTTVAAVGVLAAVVTPHTARALRPGWYGWILLAVFGGVDLPFIHTHAGQLASGAALPTLTAALQSLGWIVATLTLACLAYGVLLEIEAVIDLRLAPRQCPQPRAMRTRQASTPSLTAPGPQDGGGDDA
jgi:hypothetical protein